MPEFQNELSEFESEFRNLNMRINAMLRKEKTPKFDFYEYVEMRNEAKLLEEVIFFLRRKLNIRDYF